MRYSRREYLLIFYRQSSQSAGIASRRESVALSRRVTKRGQTACWRLTLGRLRVEHTFGERTTGEHRWPIRQGLRGRWFRAVCGERRGAWGPAIRRPLLRVFGCVFPALTLRCGTYMQDNSRVPALDVRTYSRDYTLAVFKCSRNINNDLRLHICEHFASSCLSTMHNRIGPVV